MRYCLLPSSPQARANSNLISISEGTFEFLHPARRNPQRGSDICQTRLQTVSICVCRSFAAILPEEVPLQLLAPDG